MRLMFLGDSLIEYFDWQERFSGHEVANLGVAGETVEGLLSRVIMLKEAGPEADLIFIMSGINNLAMDDTGVTGFYRVVLERLSSFYPDARIYVISLLPTLLDFIKDETVRSINASLKKLANDTGAGYLDLYRHFIDGSGRPLKDLLLDDGVHISRKGYEVWSEAVEGIVKSRDA